MFRKWQSVALVLVCMTFTRAGSAGAGTPANPSRPWKAILDYGLEPDGVVEGGVLFVLRGTGTGAHLGTMAIEGEGVSYFDDAGNYLGGDVEAHFYAANGDSLRWIHRERVTVVDGQFNWEVGDAIEGGTGRFENARGTFNATDLVPTGPLSWQVTTEGTISY